MAEKFTKDIPASELPAGHTRDLPSGPAPGMLCRVIVEPIEDEERRLTGLCAAVDAGLASLDAGRVVEGEELFRRLWAKGRA